MGGARNAARAGKNIDRIADGLASILLGDAGKKLEENFSLRFFETGIIGRLVDICAHQQHLTLRYFHGIESGCLCGRLQLCAVGELGELGEALIGIDISEYAIRFSDGNSFSSHQINADIEHEYIANQIALRILDAAQSMLADLDAKH